jgi:serine/threonine protein kinase/DNA-binding SARP family transcriptional activator
MTNWNPQANELFLRASEIEPDERRAFLDMECGHDTNLRRDVESLLKAGGQLGEFLNQPALPKSFQRSSSLPEAEDRPAQSSGELGDFRILREVGRGGMGVVYEAEQISLGRRVALKVLPFASTLDGKQLQRFKNEAQAAAQLHHTNIVPVHATGCERGVHYYAMQFIEGRTVGDLIRELRQTAGLENRQPRPELGEIASVGASPSAAGSGLAKKQHPKAESKETPHPFHDRGSGADTLSGNLPSTIFNSRSLPFFRAAASLGIQAAEALEHAHQLGVVHRDIKPANLIIESLASIGPEGEGARLWITDFGVAHCHSQAGLTMTGDLIGTLRYMSPEQALAKHALVDHRTDIYSLGATLYELLTLEPAYAGPDRQELLRQIAFEEPRAPRRMNKFIPPELETIILKSMGKSPEERYGTAQELAEDLRRYLQHEPILAKKPTWIQRANKWSRRHPAVVRSAMVVLFLITAGSLLSTWLIWQEKQRTSLARDQAESNEKLAIEQQHRAEDREGIERAVRNFWLNKVLLQSDPTLQANALLADGASAAETKWNPTIGELLDRAARQLTPDKIESLFPKPVIRADILEAVGQAYDGIGDYGSAIAFLERARNLKELELGPNDPDALKSLNNLAVACRSAGKLAEAIRLFEQLHERQIQSLGPDDRITLITMNNLAVAYKDSSQTTKAIQLLEQVRDKQIEKLGPDDSDTLNTINNLAVAYQTSGKLSEAIRIFEQLRDQRIQKQGPNHPETLITLGNLALAYQEARKLPEAIPLFEEVRDKQIQELGPDHPQTLTTKDNLAKAYQDSKRLLEAIPLYEEVLSKRLPRLGPEHARTLVTRDRLAQAYLEAGRVPDAIRLFEQMREKLIEKVGPDDSRTLTALNNLAFFYWMAKQLDRSVPLFEQVLKNMRKKLGDDHPETINAISNLAINYGDAGRLTEAEPLCREFLERIRGKWVADHPQTANALAQLGSNLLRQEKSTEAESFLRECLAIRQKKEANAWTTFSTQSMLGEALLGQKKYAEAEPFLRQGYEGMKEREKMIPPPSRARLTEALERLLRLYEANGQKDMAEMWRQQLAEQKKK